MASQRDGAEVKPCIMFPVLFKSHWNEMTSDAQKT